MWNLQKGPGANKSCRGHSGIPTSQTYVNWMSVETPTSSPSKMPSFCKAVATGKYISRNRQRNTFCLLPPFHCRPSRQVQNINCMVSSTQISSQPIRSLSEICLPRVANEWEENVTKFSIQDLFGEDFWLTYTLKIKNTRQKMVVAVGEG